MILVIIVKYLTGAYLPSIQNLTIRQLGYVQRLMQNVNVFLPTKLLRKNDNTNHRLRNAPIGIALR